MKLAAVAGLIAVCVWAGYSFPVLALTGLFIFAVVGGVCEVVRNG